MMPKKNVADEAQLILSLMFLSHLGVFYDLLLQRPTAS